MCFSLIPYIAFNWAHFPYVLPFSCARINKICVLGLGFLDYMVVKTLGSFHKLVVSKLEDDACSEVASESA